MRFRKTKIAVLCLVLPCAALFLVYTIDWNVRVNWKPWLNQPWRAFRPAHTLAPECQHLAEAPARRRPAPLIVPDILLRSMDECLGFARSIGPNSYCEGISSLNGTLWFHTHWRADMDQQQFGFMIQSFAATQATRPCHLGLKLWVEDQDAARDLIEGSVWQTFKSHLGERLENAIFDELGALPPWLLGLEVLREHGGVWFPPSLLFLRDWMPLLAHNKEWLTHTDGHALEAMDPRLMVFFFTRQSASLCQLVHTIRDLFYSSNWPFSWTAPRQKPADARPVPAWVFGHVYRTLIKHQRLPWILLPWCYMNAASTDHGNDPLTRDALDSLFAIDLARTSHAQQAVLSIIIDSHRQNLAR